jgi:hypothetical protein
MAMAMLFRQSGETLRLLRPFNAVVLPRKPHAMVVALWRCRSSLVIWTDILAGRQSLLRDSSSIRRVMSGRTHPPNRLL